ncbi:hypothetical protein ABH940_000945 [Streptacidiphilus sp. BW17]|uniref:hypothetical protein n=1 Tax=Streptacidiphilus sp. BW17 TaxID=3156274 RepID=UPI003518B593
MSALPHTTRSPHPQLDRPRLVLTAGVATALLLVLALGTDTVWLALTDAYGGRLLRPAALGLPLFLPGLRPDPRGDTTWAYLWCEDFAALLLVGAVALVLRRHVLLHPYASRLHRLITGWGAVVLGGAVAGLFRGLIEARMTGDGPIGWTGYPVTGAVAGALWGVALGWTVGVTVAAVSRGATLRRIARGVVRLGGVGGRRAGVRMAEITRRP